MSRPAPIGLPSAGTVTSQTLVSLPSSALAAGPNSAPARCAGSYVVADFSLMTCGARFAGADWVGDFAPVAGFVVPALGGVPVPGPFAAGGMTPLAGGITGRVVGMIG